MKLHSRTTSGLQLVVACFLSFMLPACAANSLLQAKGQIAASGQVSSAQIQQKQAPALQHFSVTLEHAITQAGKDLSQRLGHKKFSVVQANQVTWSDTSAGCPQQGFAYAQVITQGYLIVLKAAHQQYRYHGTQGAEPKFCPASQVRPPLKKS